MSPLKAGLIAGVLLIVGIIYAYTQVNPFAESFKLQRGLRDDAEPQGG